VGEASISLRRSLAKLEAMTTVCSVGLDMVAVPGDTSAATLVFHARRGRIPAPLQSYRN
jgi:uncharacterized protein (UPF0210 family)